MLLRGEALVKELKLNLRKFINNIKTRRHSHEMKAKIHEYDISNTVSFLRVFYQGLWKRVLTRSSKCTVLLCTVTEEE
jgi:hypothetical protein